jgi:hypothetical protein
VISSIYWKVLPDNFVVKFSLIIFACSAVSFASFAGWWLARCTRREGRYVLVRHSL